MNTEPLTRTDDLVGRVLLGRYRVVRELAKGGMGIVYLARAEGAVGFVKPVVVKLVLPEHAQDERIVGMFVREAQILAHLRHPSVVDVLEFGEQDGAYVLVLEYVRGYHLGQWMRYLYLKQREAPVEILIQIVIDVLEALHHAHNQVHPDGTPMQIVHRDVSPSNILLDEDGRGRLLDFGVARMRGGGTEYKTQVKGFMGKLPYTAPEVFAGAPASPRSDLYACGVVLHEVLLGRNVFRSENQAATLHKVMTHVPEPVEGARGGVPAGLDAVLQQALAKSPDDRYPDARAFAGALRRLQHEQESEIRARLAELLKVDFGREMAELLKLESLADRDEAWRRLSEPPRPFGEGAERRSEPHGLPPAPAAAGDTVVVRRARLTPPVGNALPPAQAPAPPIAAPAPSAVQTPATALPHAAPSPAPSHEFSPAPALPHAAPAPEFSPTPPPSPTHSRTTLFALGAVGALAVFAIVLALRPRAAPAAAPVMPPIQVVTQQHAPEPAAYPGPADPTPPSSVEPPSSATAEAAADEPEPAATRTERTPRRGARSKSGPDPQDLTRAFRRQQPKLERCYEQHSTPGGPQPATQIEFDLDARGKLTAVAIAPRSLAGTPLAQCLLKVARSTTFPAQGQPVSFSIPVSASRK